MRIAEVIGTVTLSKAHPTVNGFRWIIGIPCSREALENQGRGDGEEKIMLDQLGAGTGQYIGFSEGGEAAAPFFPEQKPVDAYCACLLDQITVSKSK